MTGTTRKKRDSRKHPARRTPTKSIAAAAPTVPSHPWRSPVADIEASESGPQVAAIFDFDGTLIAGYSILTFLAEQARQGELDAADIVHSGAQMLRYLSGGLTQRDLIQQGFMEWRGRSVRAMEKLGQRLFEERLEDDIYPQMREIAAAHRKRGHTLVIASSGTRFQIEPAARHLGIEHVVCTRLRERGGKLNGRPDGPILWGRHKALAVQSFSATQGVDLGKSFFYADGDEDEALMHLVGRPRPVNPRPQLERVAARRHWPVHRFVSRGTPGAGTVLRNLGATASAVPVFLGAAALRLLTGRKREAANVSGAVLTDISLLLGGVQLNVIGEQHLWSQRPAVFIWNHRNIFDAYIAGNLVRLDFGAVAKKELEKVPFFAIASRFMHIAFVDRSNSRAALETLKPATELLANGISMLVAPEGHRHAGPGVGGFKKGAFRMAMDAGVPIVPIVIRNVDDIGARGASIMRPGTVDVAVLPPISVADWTLEDLPARIQTVRQLYLDTLVDWPGHART